MKIYTRTGDSGQTALFGGGRVSKDHVRVEAYGDVDELNAHLGLVRATDPTFESSLLESIQRDLFAIGGQLATPDPSKVEEALKKAKLDAGRISAFETAIDRLNDHLDDLTNFVLPGGTALAAHLHVARTVTRRAERRVVALAQQDEVPAIVLTYLNRLSDLLFTLAREANRRSNRPDVTW